MCLEQGWEMNEAPEMLFGRMKLFSRPHVAPGPQFAHLVEEEVFSTYVHLPQAERWPCGLSKNIVISFSLTNKRKFILIMEPLKGHWGGKNIDGWGENKDFCELSQKSNCQMS